MPKVVAISPEAARVMTREFVKRTPAKLISQIVHQEAGELITPRTIERRAAEWRASEARKRAAKEQMEALVAATKSSDLTAEEMLRALAFQSLMEDPVALQMSPINLQALRIDERKVALKERQVAVEERRVKLLEDREQRAIAALQGKDGAEALTPEQLVEKIRGIYGLQGDA